MTGASPVTTIDGLAWLCHAVLVSIVVTGLAPLSELQGRMRTKAPTAFTIPRAAFGEW